MPAEKEHARQGIRRRRSHITFATRLLIGGLGLSLGLIVAVSGFLLVSRSQQTTTVALSNADNRAKVVRGLIQQITAPQARIAARNVAAQSLLTDAMSLPGQAAAVTRLFAGNPNYAVPIPNENLVIFGRDGTVLHTTESASVPQLSPAVAGVRAGLGGRAGEGVEILSSTSIVYDVTVPVMGPPGTPVLGAVVYSIPLNVPLNDLSPAVGYPTAMFANRSPHSLLRIGARGMTQVAFPSQLTPAFSSSSPDLVDAMYTVPGVGDVAASFVALGDPLASSEHAQQHVGAYVGVEVPLQPFFENQSKDEVTVVLLGLTAAAIVVVAVLLFVNRFVRRPVSRLGEGVFRIAGGDYSSDIPVDTRDELGLLAEGVNTMRANIASYVRHVDGAVARLGEVSHALTMTTGGVEMLEQAVCDSAVAITGGEATAYLLQREDDELVARAAGEIVGAGRETDDAVTETVLGGGNARSEEWGAHRLFLPMFYQGAVVGALVVVAVREPSAADAQALGALANNAAVAIENTRLFEQEKETVVRLRQLDAMKADFLATAQHELRTPVTAIMGQLDLIKVAWSQWDDAMKLGIIGDIEVSTRLLGELLESIIDFSLLSAESLNLKVEAVHVGPAVDEAAGEVAHHFLDGIPVTLKIAVGEDLWVTADGSRFRQVIRCVLDNAVKFTGPGGRVDVIGGAGAAGGVCTVEIIDEGMGIETEALPHIFERFFQANNTKTRKFGGLGMGLALAREICIAHGATITVTSVVGEGSRFTIIWPMARAVDLAAPAGAADTFHVAVR